MLGKVIFLEFTRAMDNPDNMAAACEAKGKQYRIPLRALMKAQEPGRRKRGALAVASATTAPLIFGVRGTVLMDVAASSLESLGLNKAQLHKVLASGVRAAITAASEMCAARFAALRTLPAQPRGANGKRQKQVIPPKPTRLSGWRSERGWA